MKGRQLLYVLIFLMAYNCGFGQVEFTIIAPDTVPLNQIFELDIVINDSHGTHYKPPHLQYFEIIKGPSMSHSTNWTHNQISSSVTYAYQLKPVKEGICQTGTAEISVDSIVLKSNNLSILITPAITNPADVLRAKNAPKLTNDTHLNSHRTPDSDTSLEVLTKKVKDDVFVQLKVNKNKLYLGDTLVMSLMLYFGKHRNIDSIDIGKEPKHDGFKTEEIVLNPKRRPLTDTFNGIPVNSIELERFNLYPQHIGSYKIPAPDVKVSVAVIIYETDNLWDTGYRRSVTVRLSPVPVTIVVKENPQR